MKYITAHGFNVHDGGDGTVGQIEPHLEFFLIKYRRFSWPWTFLFTLAHRTKEAAQRLFDMADGQPIGVITHSHGVVIALEAIALGAQIKHIVAINPALRRSARFPPSVMRVDVVFNEGDYTVELARAWRGFADEMPWRRKKKHWWGAMGRRGPDYTDPRMHLHETSHKHKHSGIFKKSSALRALVRRTVVEFRSGHHSLFY